MSTQYRTFPFLSMGSFCVGRSGRSPEGDGSCGPGGGFWWCDPCAPTANRTALQTPDLRPRRAIDAPGPKLVRPQRLRIVCSLVRQDECASGAAAWGSLGAPGRPQPARRGRPGRAWTVSPGWRREGVPAGVAGATKNKLRRRRMDVISPPRFFSLLFSPLFSSRGQGCDAAKDFSFVRAPRGDGKSI